MLDEIAQLICHTIQYVKYMHNIEKVDILFHIWYSEFRDIVNSDTIICYIEVWV